MNQYVKLNNVNALGDIMLLSVQGYSSVTRFVVGYTESMNVIMQYVYNYIFNIVCVSMLGFIQGHRYVDTYPLRAPPWGQSLGIWVLCDHSGHWMHIC